MGPIWLLLTIPVVLGLLLTFRGWRGRRVDEHPLCRKCGYDLHGHSTPSACPECGRDLARRRAIRVGHRRKRRLSLLAGMFLLLASLGVGGAVGWPFARDFDYNTIKPMWLLKREATSASFPKAAAAQKEILARLNNHRLGDDQILQIVNESLAIQNDANAIWDPWRGDFIESAWQNEKISKDVLLSYLKTIVTDAVTMRLPASAAPGSMMRIAVQILPRRNGTHSEFEVEVQWAPLKRNDGIVLWESDGRLNTPIGGGSWSRTWKDKAVYWGPGRYHLTSDVVVCVGLHREQFLTDGTREEKAAFREHLANFGDTDESWIMATWPITLEADFEVVPREEHH